MFIKKAVLFVVLAMVGVFLTLSISVPGYPYATENTNIVDYGKWYRHQRTKEENLNKYLYIVNEDKIMLYFSSLNGGQMIAVGFKIPDQNLSNKPPLYKSRTCCWHEVEFILPESEGRVLLQNQDWIWAIGEEKVVQTSMLRDVLENNEVKFQYYIEENDKPQETQFKFNSKELMEGIRWLLDSPDLKIEYTE